MCVAVRGMSFFFLNGGGKVHRQKDLIGMIPSLIDSFVLVCMSQPGNTSSTGSLRKVPRTLVSAQLQRIRD